MSNSHLGTSVDLRHQSLLQSSMYWLFGQKWQWQEPKEREGREVTSDLLLRENATDLKEERDELEREKGMGFTNVVMEVSTGLILLMGEG